MLADRDQSIMTDFQQSVFAHLATAMLSLKQRFGAGENVADELRALSNYAFALHADLTASGTALTFSPTMLQNRGTSPSDPEFFHSLHALEDFIGIVTHS